MSLTSHLNDKQSPFRTLVEDYAPALVTAAGRSRAGRELAEQLGFYELASAPLVVPLPEEVGDKRRHSPTVGTAFDIRTRMLLGKYEPRQTASARGVEVFGRMWSQYVENGERIAELLTEAFYEAELLTAHGSEEDGDRASIVFAWCEAIYRAGIRVLLSSLPERLQASESVEDLFDSIPSAMLTDISNLRAANQEQIEQWRDIIYEGADYMENPHFTGAYLVGGADGDWFINGTLFDCKVKDIIKAPWVRQVVMQLLGYLILDLDDDYETERIGIWLPRQAVVKTWTIEEIVGDEANEMLTKARLDVQGILR